jgi:hypothetical protein
VAYYHVLLTIGDENRCVLSDLSEDQLRTQFVKPYRRGQDILCGNEIVALSRIGKVTIIRTTDISTNELERLQEKSQKQMDEINRTSRSLVILTLGSKLEDIVEAGEDVTPNHIMGAPGYDNRSWWSAVVNNPWVLTIATGLIVAALTAWLFG